jgi:diguanylate cyclase
MVEILCTLTGVISGIAIVAALMQQQSGRRRFEPNETTQSPDEAEDLKGLTTQLQMITQRVAADVSAHTQKVVNINESLLPAKNEPERILSAITDLIQANESMQGQLAEAQQRLNKQSEQIEVTARQARTDALTGLANRRALEESLKTCIDSVSHTPTTGLMLIDIDHFKSFNDSYGHITGDAVLASFARSIAKWCNGKYYSARYGGEEFAIILTGESGSALAQLAAEVRAYISEQVIKHEDLHLMITASAGLTTIQQGDMIKLVYERADEGLYRSKKAGRNRGHWLDSGEWKPFPKVRVSEPEPNKTASVEASEIVTRKHIDEIKEHITTPVLNTSHPAKSASTTNDDSEILDLSAFVERLETQLRQLSRADMPATAIMIEAIGLAPDTVRDFDRSWAEVLEIVQSNLRGIDVMCRLRQNTLCVFMPGCTLNASLERAGGMQHMLEDRQLNSVPDHFPERLAISAASAQYNEEAGPFLQRLEDALDEAQDAAAHEVVVCSATSSYFHST